MPDVMRRRLSTETGFDGSGVTLRAVDSNRIIGTMRAVRVPDDPNIDRLLGAD